MKKLCPICHQPVRVKRRSGEFKIHQRPTGTYRTYPAVLNRDLEPSLRGPGGPNAVGIPSGVTENYAWCDGVLPIENSLEPVQVSGDA